MKDLQQAQNDTMHSLYAIQARYTEVAGLQADMEEYATHLSAVHEIELNLHAVHRRQGDANEEKANQAREMLASLKRQ